MYCAYRKQSGKGVKRGTSEVAANYSTIKLMKKELVKSVLKVKRVSDRLMAMKLEVKGSILNIVKRVCSTGWQLHGGEK